MSNYQQTVDLRERMEKNRKSARPKKASEPLEKIYGALDAGAESERLKKIERPEKKALGALRQRVAEAPGKNGKKVFWILLIAAAFFGAYWFGLIRPKDNSADLKNKNWYAVKMADGMFYYGQVKTLKANPVIMENVYYDYDRDKALKEKKPFVETANIRLVKMGGDTQGGDGSLVIYPANGWPIMEPLKPDSKVLKAILEYEK